MSDYPEKRRVAEWFRRWRSPLRRFLAARNSVPVADIDDVAQEVFLRLLRYNTGEFVEHPQAYLFKIAMNVAAEWSLRSSRRFDHEPRWLDTLTTEDSGGRDLDNRAAQQEIQRALGTLTAREAAILRLHYEDGLTQAEIALRLGVTLRIVKRDFEKSYVKLRRQLDVQLIGESHGRE